MEPTQEEILTGYRRARTELDDWLAEATLADLRRKRSGTKWTNEELLFQMVFGYMVVRALLKLVHLISRLPAPVGRGFAALLKRGYAPL